MAQVPNPNEGDDAVEIREVWNHNLEAEMALIRQVIDDFPYVAMDTEFPGTIGKLLTAANPNPTPQKYEYNYDTVKTNVNLLKLIQLGLTLSDARGNLPTCGTNKQCIWQFNFREFNPEIDMHAQESIQLLRDSNINFERNMKYGVDSTRFAELLTSSGVVLNYEITWVTFHCGYDLGYLLKLLSGKDLPEKELEFFEKVKAFFPVLYDVKHMIDFCGNLYGGLAAVATSLGIRRVGISHQAGSDSLLTLRAFMKITEIYFAGSVDRFSGFLYGLDNSLWLVGTKK